MAHIQTVQTGLTVVTHVQGRVYRDQAGIKKDHSLLTRTKPQTKKRRRICLLSARDAEWLEQHGISQPCFGPGCKHQHFTRDRIEQLVRSGDLRWVGQGENVAAWHDARELVVRRSGIVGRVGVVQLRHVGC